MAQFYNVTVLDVSCNESNVVKGRVVQRLTFRIVGVILRFYFKREFQFTNIDTSGLV